MLWFRHNNNFRNHPAMKYIATRLGADGVAAAYRLLEVMCDLCGSGENFNPTVTLQPPYNDLWLANEILLPTEDESTGQEPYFNGHMDTKRLTEYLDVFQLAGLIELGEWAGDGYRIENGKRENCKVKFTTITLLQAEGLLDAWTSRYKGKGVGAGRGARTDR